MKLCWLCGDIVTDHDLHITTASGKTMHALCVLEAAERRKEEEGEDDAEVSE